MKTPFNIATKVHLCWNTKQDYSIEPFIIKFPVFHYVKIKKTLAVAHVCLTRDIVL